MTLAQLKEKCEQLGMKARCLHGEYQVTFADSSWNCPTTYYTNDIDDAAATAEAMSSESLSSLASTGAA